MTFKEQVAERNEAIKVAQAGLGAIIEDRHEDCSNRGADFASTKAGNGLGVIED